MNQAEELDVIAPEQYGSQKSKASDVQFLNTCLFYYLLRYKKFASTSVFADIIYNYDLVVHSIASLSLQRVNAPKEPIHCTFSTLQKMLHLVRTVFGESENTYVGYIWEILLKPPPQGLVQVNGSAP